jgi:hypothetical protein
MEMPRSSVGISSGALKWMVFLGAGNFLIFIFVAMYLGGVALCGGCVGGHYFVSERGEWTEVSRWAYLYSQWHAWSVFLTHPMMLISAWVVGRRRAQICKRSTTAVEAGSPAPAETQFLAAASRFPLEKQTGKAAGKKEPREADGVPESERCAYKVKRAGVGL